METKETATQSDTSLETGRVLHRVVRAMHDGQCPRCLYMDGDAMFKQWDTRSGVAMLSGWRCPKCGFSITKDEADRALKQFLPYMAQSVAIFEQWRRCHIQEADKEG